MARRIDAFFAARSRPQLAAGVYLLLGVVGSVDYLTGLELSFSIFYLAPVSLASWYSGKRAGILASLVSAAVWLAVDVTSGHQYSHPAIPVWNAAVRCMFFLVTTYLLASVHGLLRLRSLLAQRDALTNLLNAGAFRDKCAVLFSLAARGRHTMALGYIDLDGFKAINDSLGHGIGDDVLKVVGSAIADRARGSDAVARLGGDEFAILLPQTDLAGATTFFTAIRQRLLQLASDAGWPVGFSIGVVILPPPPPSPEQAIGFADKLMYEVKRSTKNDIRFREFVVAQKGA